MRKSFVCPAAPVRGNAAGKLFGRLAPALLLLLGIIIYSNTFHVPFQFDDTQNIVTNPAIRNLFNFKAVWGYDPTRFITFLSLALNYRLHQLAVPGYHVFNLAIHLGAALFVRWFILLLFSTPALKEEKIAAHKGLLALFGGLIFVCHPIQTQAVTYIIQRAASLAAFFYLLSLCLYLKARLSSPNVIPADSKRESKPLKTGFPTKTFGNDSVSDSRVWLKYYAGSILAAVAAMFTKEIAVTLPFMLLLCDFSFFRSNLKDTLKRLAPFFVILLVFLITIKATGWTAKLAEAKNLKEYQNALISITPGQYLLTQFRVIVTYLRLLLLPIHQNLDYDYPVSHTLFALPTLASFIFLLAILATAVLLFRRYRLLSFSVFFFFLAIAPESSVFPIRDVIYEHRLYLPMAGYAVFLPAVLYYLMGSKRIKTLVIILALIISCWSVMTYSRNRVWKDRITLWSDVVRKSPNKARPYIGLGGAWGNKGNLDEAIADYSQAIKLKSKDPMAYFGRGLAYGKKGETDSAIADFTKAIEINPGYIDAYQNRAVAYRKKGMADLAAFDYAKAMELLNKRAGVVYNKPAS